MSPLDLAAAGALVEILYILQGFAGHLAMTLLHVRGLLLGNGAQHRLPEVGEQRRDRDGNGQGESGGREKAERRQLGQSPSERKREGHHSTRRSGMIVEAKVVEICGEIDEAFEGRACLFGPTRFAQFGENHASPNQE